MRSHARMPARVPSSIRRDALRLGTALLVLLAIPSGVAPAHEPDHTHASLTAASFWFLASPHVSNEAQARAVEGTIREDDCPRYSSHFYNPRTDESTIANITGFCPDEKEGYTQQKAPVRAGGFWNSAKSKYLAGDRLGAYDDLGHIYHLLQDMTSPSHCHNNPHGKINDADCDQDDDDFENWGYCGSRNTKHIQEYWLQSAAQPTDRLRHNLSVLYPGGAQLACAAPDGLACPKPGEPNIAYAYVRRVAQLVYDFTTFPAILTEVDQQPDSELKRMFPSLADEAGGWSIAGADENIGWSEGECGRNEGILDIQEEWWVMENPDSDPNDFDDNGGEDGPDCFLTGGNADQRTAGGVFLENIGGGGSGAGNSDVDEVVPKRWERKAGGREFYYELYGTRENPARRTMLRIYGDILFPIAIAYGAGLLQAFVDQVVQPPTAEAGGPYVGECGVPITLDGSGSSDANGEIVSYEWDFDGDGVYDETTTVPTVTHTYHAEFTGTIRLRVTDNDNPPLSDVDEAEVTILDTIPPTITAVTAAPSALWPPNHKMVPVDFMVEATDLCDATPVSKVIEITSSDPNDDKGGQHTTPDGVIRGDLSVDLRSEWSSGRDGRTYDVRIACRDDAGNESYATAGIRVSRDGGDAIVIVESVKIEPVAIAGDPGAGTGTGGGPGTSTTLRLVGATPNPSRGNGWVEFSLRNAGAATVVVFDLNGRMVRRLAAGTRAAGRHVIPWDARGDNGVALGQGVYWLRLEAEGTRLVKRLVLVR